MRRWGDKHFAAEFRSCAGMRRRADKRFAAECRRCADARSTERRRADARSTRCRQASGPARRPVRSRHTSRHRGHDRTRRDCAVSHGPYSGSCTITTNGTTIENRIINCSTLNIDANDVTIRNSVLNLSGGANGILLGSGNRIATDFTLEYSHVNYTNGNGKVLNAFSSGTPQADYRNFTISKSHIQGGFDFFYMEGNLDGLVVEYSVLGPLGCAPNFRQTCGWPSAWCG